MNKKMIWGLAAIGVLLNSIPAMAYHDPQDRTQDYVEPQEGPSLSSERDSYDLDVDNKRAFVAPEQSTHTHDHRQQRSYVATAIAPMVTVISMAPATMTTTTVTEEIYYETVSRPVHKKAVRKWKPKPRCVCR